MRAEEKGSFRFRAKERLKGRNNIKAVFGGKRFNCNGAKLFVLRNDLPYNRICFTFSRGFGNAVARNRAKRLGREAFRLIKSRLCAGFDLILQVFPNAAPVNIKKDAKTTLSDRTEQLEILFSKAGLFK